MSDYTPKSPLEYKLEKVTITHGRNEHEFDITASVVEIEVFENLNRAYLTGSLVFYDDARIVEAVDFNGTETITIIAGLYQTDYKIKKEFAVREISSIHPASDNSDVVTLKLIDKDSYISSMINVNKMYEGKPSEIIEHVLLDNFGATKRLYKQGSSSASDAGSDLPEIVAAASSSSAEMQNTMRYLVPNMTPLEIIEKMKMRASGLQGAPYFCYSSLNDNDLRFFDLYTLLTEPSMNAENPFLYSTVYAQQNPGAGDAVSLNIMSFDMKNNENALALIMNGDVGAQYEYLDTTTALEHSFAYDVGKVFKHVLPSGANPVFDIMTQFNNKSANEYRTKRVSRIATTSTFEPGMSNIYEEGTTSRHFSKAISISLRNMLGKSSVEIHVAGRQFFPQGDHRTIGQIVSILTMANQQPKGSNEEVEIDQKRSGDYLIYGCNHIFGKTEYSVKLSLVKITNYKGNTKL